MKNNPIKSKKISHQSKLFHTSHYANVIFNNSVKNHCKFYHNNSQQNYPTYKPL